MLEYIALLDARPFHRHCANSTTDTASPNRHTYMGVYIPWSLILNLLFFAPAWARKYIYANTHASFDLLSFSAISSPSLSPIGGGITEPVYTHMPARTDGIRNLESFDW